MEDYTLDVKTEIGVQNNTEQNPQEQEPAPILEGSIEQFRMQLVRRTTLVSLLQFSLTFLPASFFAFYMNLYGLIGASASVIIIELIILFCYKHISDLSGGFLIFVMFTVPEFLLLETGYAHLFYPLEGVNMIALLGAGLIIGIHIIFIIYSYIKIRNYKAWVPTVISLCCLIGGFLGFFFGTDDIYGIMLLFPIAFVFTIYFSIRLSLVYQFYGEQYPDGCYFAIGLKIYSDLLVIPLFLVLFIVLMFILGCGNQGGGGANINCNDGLCKCLCFEANLGCKRNDCTIKCEDIQFNCLCSSKKASNPESQSLPINSIDSSSAFNAPISSSDGV